MRFLILVMAAAAMFAKPSVSSDQHQLCQHVGCECLESKAPFIVECENAELTKIPTNKLQNEPFESDWFLLFDFNLIKNITRMPVMENLLLLSFSGNPIERIEDMAFADLPRLRELRLAKARLTGKFFNGDAFKGLVNAKNGNDPLPLEILDVSYNKINHVESHAFKHFYNLKTLIISDNPIHNLDDKTSRSFNELENLVKLDLSRTGLKLIPKDFFARLSHLEELSLSGNYFKNVPDAVNFIPSLRVLNLDFNPIQVLQPRTSYFHGPSNLAMLSLSYMPSLSAIEAESFTDLQNLTVVRIAHNPKLTYMHKMAFSSSGETMREVYLQNNSLSTLAEDMLDWSALERLDAQHNPWVCDCDMAWFAHGPFQNMIVQQPQLTESVACAKPEQVLGENMKALIARNYEFVCTSATNVSSHAYYAPMIVATIFIGALMLLAATVLCTYVLYQRSKRSGFSQQRVRYRRATLESNLESIAENIYS